MSGAGFVRPLVAMPKPPASFSDHGWRAIAMCGTRWMVAARYDDAVTVEDGVVTKAWDSEKHANLFAAAPDMLTALETVSAAAPTDIGSDEDGAVLIALSHDEVRAVRAALAKATGQQGGAA